LRGDERLEPRRSRRASRHFEPQESIERLAQPAILEPSNRGVVDPRCPPQPRDLRLLGAVEGELGAQAREVGDVRHRDVDRIERHRRHGRIGRGLDRRHLVDRQDLDDRLARFHQPPREHRQIAEFANAPPLIRDQRKQRHHHAALTAHHLDAPDARAIRRAIA
jgi:hypothetical protein